MLLFLAAAFVVACSVIGTSMALYVIWRESRPQQIDEYAQADAALKPEWLYGQGGRRMDVPRQHAQLRTRHSR